MHEVSLVQSLICRVEREARRHGATGVHRVVVRIGAEGGVEPGLFRTAFESCRRGTVCDGAELELLGEKVSWLCASCGAPIPAGRYLACPVCAWPARLAGGDALVLERVELEVPDHV